MVEETALVSKLTCGDEESYIYIINEYKEKIIRLCYPYTRDIQEAEDLSQEVFLTIFKSIKNFQGRCSLSTYIYKIAISKCLDYKRKRKRSLKEFLVETFKIEKEAKTEDFVEKNHIRECIKRLPASLKEAVVLYYYVGLSQKEIGEVLGVTPKVIEGRIYRAKEKLRVELRKGEEDLWRKEEMI